METLLAYATSAIALGLQTTLMWRLNRKLGRERCAFFAVLCTAILVLANSFLFGYVLHVDATFNSDVMYWAFFGNYILYRSFGLAGTKENRSAITKYDVYEWAAAGGLLAVVLLINKFIPR